MSTFFPFVFLFKSFSGVIQFQSFNSKLRIIIQNTSLLTTFTSVNLAEKLEAIATTVVGTVRANSKGITKALTAPVKGGTNKSTFYYNDKHHCLFCKLSV